MISYFGLTQDDIVEMKDSKDVDPFSLAIYWEYETKIYLLESCAKT